MTSVPNPQPSANGTAPPNPAAQSADGKLGRPDRLSLHAVWTQLERLYEDLQGVKREDPKGTDAPRLTGGVSELSRVWGRGLVHYCIGSPGNDPVARGSR